MAADRDGGSRPTVAGPPERLRAVFRALDAAGVRWCLLRPSETLDQPEGDIDVLVERDRLAVVREVLLREDFVPVPVAGPPTDLHAVDFDASSGRFLWIHVQTQLRVASASFDARDLLAEASFAPYPQLSDVSLFWSLLLRGVLEKRDVPERHRKHLIRLAAAARDRPSKLADLAVSEGIPPSVAVELASRGQWSALRELPLGRRERPRPWRRARGLATRLRTLRAPGGVTAAVVGPDGAGKTTLVEGLRRSLPLPTRIIYMGLTGGLMPKADALRLPGLVLCARLVIIWSRYARGMFHRERGRVVLFDRYPLDGAVPPGFDPTFLISLSRRVQRAACPLPDLVLFLDAPGSVMHGRKGEYTPERLETWRAAYQALRASVPMLQVIDAEQPVERVLREAQAHVWRHSRERRLRARMIRYGRSRAAPDARRLPG